MSLNVKNKNIMFDLFLCRNNILQSYHIIFMYIYIYRFEFYLPMMFTVGVILQEKMAGILERSMVAGKKIYNIVNGLLYYMKL